MKKRLGVLMLGCLVFAIATGSALAINYDYSDAPGYGLAWHSSPRWQSLGKGWTSESGPLTPDGDSDDGVYWSTDNGTTWNNPIVQAGQTVKFRFEMYKENWGTHLYDALRVWIDWNQNHDFIDTNEEIYAAAWFFRGENGYVYGDGHAGVSKYYYQDVVIPNDAIGDYWLRARVVCDVDLGGVFTYLLPTGQIGPGIQGEVEDWKLTVERVPEPATMLLLGIGLVGLASLRRKRRQ